MHHIYHTEGFILSSRNRGEANKMLTIYTREMGLVRTLVQGVRQNKSKLRFALQDFSYIRADLVRGREMWRVTSAASLNSFPYARADKDSLLFLARASKLIERTCDGEEANAIIFDDLIQALHILDDIYVKKETKEALELHLVLRIMNTLGYIGESKLLDEYLSAPFDKIKIEKILGERKSIIAHINKAINESQL